MNVPPFLRDLNAKAEMLGFKFLGYGGNSHPRFYNADRDVVVVAPLTPSDHRSITNCLSTMERLSGRKLPRSNSGHHRFKPVRKALDTRLSRKEQESLGRVNELLAAADGLATKWLELISGSGDRACAAEARSVLSDYEQVRRELARFHRLIPPLAVA